jgi:hypothetical protein
MRARSMLGVIIFGLVFIKKKVIKPNFFFKKKTETDLNRPVSVRFFKTKPGSNWFGLVFSGLAWFFLFSSVFSVSGL